MATRIRGIEGMKHGELDFEIQRGAQGENPVVKGLPFTLLSLAAGWWGIPWGPIYTIQSVYNNSRGGEDVTQAVVNSLRGQSAPAQSVSPIPPAS